MGYIGLKWQVRAHMKAVVVARVRDLKCRCRERLPAKMQ